MRAFCDYCRAAFWSRPKGGRQPEPRPWQQSCRVCRVAFRALDRRLKRERR